MKKIKRAKDLNRHFTKEDIQMADKHKGAHYSSGKWKKNSSKITTHRSEWQKLNRLTVPSWDGYRQSKWNLKTPAEGTILKNYLMVSNNSSILWPCYSLWNILKENENTGPKKHENVHRQLYHISAKLEMIQINNRIDKLVYL